MAGLKYLIPALAVAGRALAQNGCSADSNTIQNQGDATSLANCQTISGDVIIASQAAGAIQLDGVQQIMGNFNASNSFGLASIEANDLTSIGKGFILNNMTTLSGLNFPQLTKVDSIQWEALPALQNLTFNQKISQASNVLVTNTQLQSLDGIDLQMVDNFNINNNPFLTSITSQLSNITTSLTIQANAKNLVASFPSLETALNITVRNCSNMMVPSLSTVNGSLIMDDNFFTSFAAPNLTECGGISFAGNSQLTNISLPLLQTVNGQYQIANNTGLLIVSGQPALKTVTGAIDFSGNFTNVSLPAIADVRGGFNLQTSATFDCSAFQTDSSNGVIKGTYVCAGKQANPGTAGSPTSTSSSASPTKSGDANSQRNVNAMVVVGFSAVVAGMLHWSL